MCGQEALGLGFRLLEKKKKKTIIKSEQTVVITAM